MSDGRLKKSEELLRRLREAEIEAMGLRVIANNAEDKVSDLEWDAIEGGADIDTLENLATLKPISVLSKFTGERYVNDVQRICDVMEAKGFACTVRQATAMWEMVSAEMCSGWITLPKCDESLFWELMDRFEVVEGN